MLESDHPDLDNHPDDGSQRGPARANVLETVGFVPEPGEGNWYYRPSEHAEDFELVFGALRCRAEPDGKARLRVESTQDHANAIRTIHGGFLLAYVDMALFLGPAALGLEVLGGVTIEASTQFLAPLEPGKPVDAVIEVLRETGRMVFIRGTMEQDGVVAVAFSGTTRKVAKPRHLPPKHLPVAA